MLRPGVEEAGLTRNILLVVRSSVMIALAAGFMAGCGADGEVGVEAAALVADTRRWTAVSNGVAPPGMYAGGSENGGALGVCVAAYNGGTHGGKIVGGKCNIGWGGNEVVLASYQALTDVAAGSDVWVAGANGSYPADAL